MWEYIHQWIADYTEGSICQEDLDKLECWIKKDPAHKAIFEDYLRMYKETHEMGFVDSMNLERSWKSLDNKLKQKRRVKFIRVMVAASVFLAGIVGGVSTNERTFKKLQPQTIPDDIHVTLYMADGKSVNPKNKTFVRTIEKDGTQIGKDTTNTLVYHADAGVKQSVIHTVSVPVGGEFALTLADGTRVWLNSDTKFRFPTHFPGETREVYVEGEAYFSVSKTRQPFIVHTGRAQVRVLGTEFNLSAYPGEKMITTLASGQVEVSDNIHKVCLTPGEQAISGKGSSCIKVHKVDVKLYSSWLKGIFEFENVSLQEIAKQLSRWYGVTFVFDDEECGNRCFTGGIKKYTPLNKSLEVLEKATDIIFLVKDRVVLVRSRIKARKFVLSC